MILHSNTAQAVVISTTPQPASEAVRRFTIPLAPATSPESGARPAFIMSLDRWTRPRRSHYLPRRSTDAARHLVLQQTGAAAPEGGGSGGAGCGGRGSRVTQNGTGRVTGVEARVTKVLC